MSILTNEVNKLIKKKRKQVQVTIDKEILYSISFKPATSTPAELTSHLNGTLTTLKEQNPDKWVEVIEQTIQYVDRRVINTDASYENLEEKMIFIFTIEYSITTRN